MSSHLCKTDLGSDAGSGSARYPLISNGSDLLIIKNTAAWSNNTMVVTPQHEYYAQCVTLGLQSNYSTAYGYSDSEALSMQTRIANLRDNMTLADWNEGHRPMFQYWSRGYCPYQIKYDSSMNTQKLLRYMELCAVYKCLEFDLHCLPIGCFSSFSAYLRCWNGSIAEFSDQDTFFQYGLHYDAHKIYYRFSDAIHPPKFHRDTTEYGISYGTADTSSKFNQGKGGDFKSPYYLPYDPWNAHDGTASSTSYMSSMKFKLWGQYSSDTTTRQTPYYTDVQITGNGLETLKKACSKGNKVYLHLGYTNNDAQSKSASNNVGQKAYSTISVYCSRIELVLVATWAKFNN